MLPEFPTTLQDGRFPFPEGQQWEFKAGTVDRIKLYKTICAMLNSTGGYIVIGITDDLTICGVQYEAKKFDQFALHIDDIWHCSMIVKDSGERIAPNSVRIERKILAEKSIIVITVKPDTESASKTPVNYKLKTGEFWVRLSASNYCVSESQLLEPHNVNQMIRQREELAREKERKAAFEKEMQMKKSYTNMLRSFQKEIALRREEESRAVQLLFKKILEEKLRVEKQILAANQSWITALFCTCFPLRLGTDE